MSMVGYILGCEGIQIIPRDKSDPTFRLGDRHCENIMMDAITGDTVHCDFNCLFDRVSASLRLGFVELICCITTGEIL